MWRFSTNEKERHKHECLWEKRGKTERFRVMIKSTLSLSKMVQKESGFIKEMRVLVLLLTDMLN